MRNNIRFPNIHLTLHLTALLPNLTSRRINKKQDGLLRINFPIDLPQRVPFNRLMGNQPILIELAIGPAHY